MKHKVSVESYLNTMFSGRYGYGEAKDTASEQKDCR